MNKRLWAVLFVVLLAMFSLCGCAETEITVFAAKSLSAVMDTIIERYAEVCPDVHIIASYDSSGTLMTQIESGAQCDVFFSAAQKQMNTLENEGLILADTRVDVVNNLVCVVTWKGSGTAVTGIDTLDKAASLAIADGSVPVGRYTRVALINMGIVPEHEDASSVTTQELSDALGGMEINACANVGAVAVSVSEGSNEVGTVYYSDTFGYDDRLEIIQIVPTELTGSVIYPAAVVNDLTADAERQAAARAFVLFLKSDEAGKIFTDFRFDTNV